MSTNPKTLEQGTILLHYRLLALAREGQRDVWRAEDTRSGRVVAVKILSRSAPKEKGRRDALLARFRQNASFQHPAFPVVYEVAVTDDDTLFMAMEWADGEPLTERVARALPSRDEFLKWAWQLTEALAALHKRELVHGNFSGQNIYIDSASNLRLLGVGVATLSDRRERFDITNILPGTVVDLEALSFASPEQLSGKPIEVRSDIFSIGLVLYLIGTGKPAFTANSAEEVVNAVTKTNPRNPLELNPKLEPPLLQLIGKSVFKNPASRFSDANALLAEISRLEPKIQTLAAYPKVSRGEVTATRKVVNLFVAELAYYDLLAKKNPDRAIAISAKMQQMLGEAVYLFDGQVIDSFGPRMVAIVPDAANAIAAARKAVADLKEYDSSITGHHTIEPRMVLHRDEVVRREMAVEGRGFALVEQVIASLEPNQILVSEPLLKAAGITPSTFVGEVGGVRFSNLSSAEEVTEPAPAPIVASAAAAAKVSGRIPVAAPVAVAKEEEGESDEPDSEAPMPPPAPAKRSMLPLAAVIGGVVLVGGLAGFVMLRKHDDGSAVPVAASAVANPKTTSTKVVIEPFAITVPDAAMASAVANVGPALNELLRQSGGVELASAGDPTAARLGVKVVDPAVGVIPHLSGKGEGQPIPLQNSAEVTLKLASWFGQQLNVPTDRIVARDAGAMQSFALAAAQYRSGDPVQMKNAEGAILEAMQKDPVFLPAHRLGLEIFSASGDVARKIDIAEKLTLLDPADTATRDKLMVWKLEAGKPVDAMKQVSAALKANGSDLMALQVAARYALSAGDEKTFQKAINKIDAVSKPADGRWIHRPDIFSAAGDFDRAATMYYDIEVNEPQNAALALKIGRIAALRQSWEIADIELKKLQKLSPNYGAPLLEAYIAAQKKEAGKVGVLLQQAQANASWHDDVYTSSAEIYALLSQKTKVVDSLEKAVARGEGTATMILLKQPFFYIGYDAKSNKVKSDLEQQKAELRTMLSTVPLS